MRFLGADWGETAVPCALISANRLPGFCQPLRQVLPIISAIYPLSSALQGRRSKGFVLSEMIILYFSFNLFMWKVIKTFPPLTW